ncbi:MAG TPA: hypothetical protein V6C88_16690 [Chroococcidiopsis sp.]
MRDFQRDLNSKDKLFMILGSVVGGGITMVIITVLPIAQATLVSAIVLASLIVTCSYLSNPVLWWMGVGAIAGVIIGIGGVMGEHLATEQNALEFHQRLTFVGFQGIAGFISGVLLSRKVHQPHLPTLKEFISSLSALTAGTFAVVVTIRFLFDGLEPARALASRLSTATTILITVLALPASLGYLLAEQRSRAHPH